MTTLFATKISKIKHGFLDLILDKYFNIQTRTSHHEIRGPSEEYHGYEPIDWISFPRILKKLNISPEDTFVDIGSGKGRALLMAAKFPFKKIIGVEYQEHLCAVAQKNLQEVRHFKKQCQDFLILNEDAAKFNFPDQATYVFLANPFSEKILNIFLSKMAQSLRSHPRKLIFIYRVPVYSKAVENLGLFEDIPLQIPKYKTRYKLYRSK